MLEAIKKRRSIRKYQDKEIEKEKIEEILRAAMTAPSAHHRRSWKFWLVRDKKKKEKLSQIHRWSSFVANAPIVLVIGSDEDKRWVENCAVVAALVYLEVTNQGLGTCWVQVRGMKTLGGKSSEEEAKKIINASKEIRILCLMPIGYPQKVPREHLGEIEKEKVSVV
jgi:nitroreductase